MGVVNDGERQRRLRHAMVARVDEGWDVMARESDRYLLRRFVREKRHPLVRMVFILFTSSYPVREERGILTVDPDGEIVFDRIWADMIPPR